MKTKSMQTCTNCNGKGFNTTMGQATGYKPEIIKVECPKCKGTGEVVKSVQEGNEEWKELEEIMVKFYQVAKEDGYYKSSTSILPYIEEIKSFISDLLVKERVHTEERSAYIGQRKREAYMRGFAEAREKIVKEILIFFDKLEVQQPQDLKTNNWRNWKYIRNSIVDKYLSETKKEEE